ncbi:LuxR C-terminal-related transcriptional regulator [Streptomyces erythrochromogenes]|uniref:helix-turn-helix transcriptional regulator n=1 Tax=Streptomyces erythrochromogenes TaxID=285574 RepID=UPI00381E869F
MTDTHGSGATWPLTGRGTELEQFAAALDDTSLGAFLVFGPPGAGRSRLAAECRRRAADAGHPVSVARATAAAARVPLGALAHLLPPDVSPRRPAQLYARASAHLPRPAGLRRRPVLCVDDLHLLDTASTVLVRQLLDAGRVFVLGTVRSDLHDTPGAAATAVMAEQDSVRRVDLAPLDEARTATLLRDVLGRPVTGRAVSRLHHLSGGMPLPLRELVRAALARSTLTSDGTVWDLTSPDVPLTPHLAGRLRAQLRAVAPTRKLEVLAACGPCPLAYALEHLDHEQLTALERAGLVTVTRDGRRTSVRLAQPLHTVVLQHDMPEVRSRRLLLHYLAWNEEHGSRRSGDRGMRATLTLRATGHSLPGAMAEAVRHAADLEDLDRARRLLESVPTTQRDYEALHLLGQALFRAGDCTRAEWALAQAAALADDEREVRDTLAARVHNFVYGLGGATDRCRAAIEECGSRVTTAVGRAELSLLRGAAAFGAGEFRSTLDLCTAFERSRAALEPATARLTVRAQLLEALSLACLGRADEAVAVARAAAGTAIPVSARDPYAEVTAAVARDTVLVNALTAAGRYREALAHGQRPRPCGGRRPFDPYESRWLAMALGRAALAGGRLEQARLLFAEVVRATRARHAALYTEALFLQAAAAAQQGDLEAATSALEEGRRAVPSDAAPDHAFAAAPDHAFAAAWTAACRGEVGRARHLLTTAAEQARSRGHTWRESVLLTDLTRLGGAAEAAPRLSEIAAELPEPRHLARSALARAWRDRDPDGLLELADRFHACGADLLAAEAACTAAASLRTQGRERLARAAARTASTFLDRCQGALTPVLRVAQAATRLSERETEIALLASRGVSNKQMGADLHISPRTVENHLNRIYHKLGVGGRGDLAAVLRPNGHAP